MYPENTRNVNLNQVGSQKRRREHNVGTHHPSGLMK